MVFSFFVGKLGDLHLPTIFFSLAPGSAAVKYIDEKARLRTKRGKRDTAHDVRERLARNKT